MSEDRGNKPEKEEEMFKFEQGEFSSPRQEKTSDISPKSSPRDKKAKVLMDETESLADKKPTGLKPFMVAASPPKFVSFEEIMKAANGVSNMVLAHEIAVDNDFRFNKQELPKNSLEKQVADIMKRAFWDVLHEKLQEDPPDYSHGLVLLQEVKETLESILLPQHQRLKLEINEILDLELIKQKAENDALNFLYYADFVIAIMAKMCSPIRDESIAKLKEIKDVVPLFKGIFELIELMKMDMANYTIKQIRPYLQQQSVEYERTKFKEFLKQSEENNVDGLRYTRSWLERHGLNLYYKSQQQSESNTSQASNSTSNLTSAEGGSNPSPLPLTPLNIMNTAYMELLNWPSNQGYPETVVMDEKRFNDLENKLKWLILTSSILLVTYNTVGGAIAGISGFKEKLKDRISIILKDVSEKYFLCNKAIQEYSKLRTGRHICSNLKEAMKNLAVQLEKEVCECLTKHGYPELDQKRRDMLQGQIQEVQNTDHPVHSIMRSRVEGFIKDLLVGKKSSELKIPIGFSAVTEELKHVCGQFLRLVSHNRQVFGQFYADIVGTIMKKYEHDMDQSDSGTPV